MKICFMFIYKKENDATIKIIRPKPYERVGGGFRISGRIPKSWLKTDCGYSDYRVFGTFIDINGFEFAGTVTAHISIGLFNRFKKELYFSTNAQFSEFNEHFIARSQGRIILKLFNQKEGSDIYIPLIVNGFEPIIGVDPRIEEEHKNISKKIIKYNNDLNDYQKELHGIFKRKVFDHQILEGVFNILEESKENFKPISKCEEDILIENLEEKYKEAIKWEKTFSSRIGAAVGKMFGFEFRVYSADYNPKHFHVIHKGRGIEARFSYPEINLINYKGKSNTIGRKEIEKIIDFFNIHENCQKLSYEFQRQVYK